ncbi:short-chain dehydrogenase [Ophiostoma piceae UAMH 11346]|uniref:Short-chain dehydrogenase n=1 Tax=Ophiostoma piceae (strain UAMH 11346) TaxID=1262450 RepID=S3C073_OPHP1|nr:short-chain dehydrogenase [Ophiostoma piceae UAMH 11346]
MSDLSRYPPGIGLALARHVLDNGHLLVATPRNPAKTPELVKEVEANGNGSRWLTLDVDDPEAAGRLVRRLEGEDGISINVLVNNAGFAILQTVEHAVLPGMRRRRFGVIVYISTGSGLEARPSMSNYGSAKAAGDALIKTLAKEVAAFNIRAFYASLGAFQTKMGAPSGEGDPARATKAIFDLATAQGSDGKGREAKTLLPLGRDAAVRAQEVRDSLDHALDVFGDVANNVRCD